MFFHKTFDLSAAEAKQRMEKENIYLLDVRTLEEYQEGHLPQSHLIPLDQLSTSLQQIPKTVPVFLYCRSGQRANTAKKTLLANGFQDVYNIGGVMQWPYPLEK